MKLGFKHDATGDLVSIGISPRRIGNIIVKSRGFTKVSSLDGLKFIPSCIVKEFPDLEGKPIAEMKTIAVERIREKVKLLDTEDNITDYLKDDLAKHGYTLVLKQRAGFRPEHIK